MNILNDVNCIIYLSVKPTNLKFDLRHSLICSQISHPFSFHSCHACWGFDMHH